ncbi:hypothetical protein C8R42DRAFT_214469 [Lentinula raphanica]|nr:hypothetical protein C8R42DRAFT_214469 [Lentinula raphanica]
MFPTWHSRPSRQWHSLVFHQIRTSKSHLKQDEKRSFHLHSELLTITFFAGQRKVQRRTFIGSTFPTFHLSNNYCSVKICFRLLVIDSSSVRHPQDLALMHFRIVFFIVWLVAAACAAPIPQITGAPSLAMNPNLPVMVKILYNSKGVPKKWGDEDHVHEKMQQGVLDAAKSKENSRLKPLFSKERKVEWEYTVDDKLVPESKADLAIFPEYIPCNDRGCVGGMERFLDLETLEVTVH